MAARHGATASEVINVAAESELMNKTLHDELDSLNRKNPGIIKREDYYRIQSNQDIGETRLPVPVYFDRGLDESWVTPLFDAMEAINKAAPGLDIHKVTDVVEGTKNVIRVFDNHDNKETACYTENNIHFPGENGEVKISLHKERKNKKGIALHEMMHALGFEHEHQRKDRDEFITYDTSKLDDDEKKQYEVMTNYIGLSQFDATSIMIYPTCEALQLKPAEAGLQWKTKGSVGHKEVKVLSELDKVVLNMVYHPVKYGFYPPDIKSSKTGLMYCGRENCVQAGNRVCGPEKGANCPACRVLKTEKSKEIKDLDKWQGWTGLVYCGKQKGRQGEGEGLCGPDQGEPCSECGKLIGYYDDNPEDQDAMQ